MMAPLINPSGALSLTGRRRESSVRRLCHNLRPNPALNIAKV